MKHSNDFYGIISPLPVVLSLYFLSWRYVYGPRGNQPIYLRSFYPPIFLGERLLWGTCRKWIHQLPSISPKIRTRETGLCSHAREFLPKCPWQTSWALLLLPQARDCSLSPVLLSFSSRVLCCPSFLLTTLPSSATSNTSLQNCRDASYAVSVFLVSLFPQLGLDPLSQVSFSLAFFSLCKPLVGISSKSNFQFFKNS